MRTTGAHGGIADTTLNAKLAARNLYGRGAQATSRSRLLGTGGPMSGTYTVFGCYRAPAHYDAVQIVLVSTANDTVNAFKASVAAPARFNDGVNAQDAAGAAITPTPVTWGTTNPRSPRNPGGGAASTFLTGASGTAPNQIEARAISDIIPLSSIDRADTPGALPLLMVRVYGTSVPGMASAGLSVASASSLKQINPDHFCQYVQNADHTATASGVPVQTTVATTQWAPAIEIIYYLRGARIMTVAATGHSIDMGWANSTAVNSTIGQVNGWHRRFVTRLRSVRPAGLVAWHRDGFNATRFNEMAMNSLLGDEAAGITHLFINPASVNSWRTDPASVGRDLRRVSHMLDLCYRIGVVPILVYPWAGQDVGSVAELQVRAYIDAAKARGVFTFDARAILTVDGSVTSNVLKPEYLTRDANGAIVDTTHISDAAQAVVAELAFQRRGDWGL